MGYTPPPPPGLTTASGLNWLVCLRHARHIEDLIRAFRPDALRVSEWTMRALEETVLDNYPHPNPFRERRRKIQGVPVAVDETLESGWFELDYVD